MCQQTEGLGQFPFGECVSRKARVYQCQSARKIIVRQIGEIATQLAAGQHAFIDDVLARQRADVEILAIHAIFNSLAYLI